MMWRLIPVALLLLAPLPAQAVAVHDPLPLREDRLVLTYCGLGETIYACLDIGVPPFLEVAVSPEPAPLHLITREQGTALGLPLGVAMDFYGTSTSQWYSTDWLYWGPLGLDVGVALEAITRVPRFERPLGGESATDAPLTQNPEPATLLLVGITLVGIGWRLRRP